MILHVSQQRFDNHLSQGYPLRSYPPLALSEISSKPGDTTYHILSGETGRCDACNAEFESLKFDTPADLEMLKEQRRRANA
jgi:hypothetical protein